MPAPTDANLRREGETLRFTGALERAAVAVLWPQALAVLAGVARFDLRDVSQVDSAGLALLGELAARAGGGIAFDSIAIDGEPAGLAALRTAYRLDPSLGFAT
ncbi:STAS domain-containing protein [Lysobacter sp. CFH 32150]|uniref:STAS domain-containing protein n=1 Tax=Lysobacter sp. CFH 32150 TaxID=2927128 RepID=UPI001FA6FC56|nr:STAS domain-containing protein [Lysobacter sp. CFH 32150]MCI4568044.1 STAS domain-containing protein [Lysobacter sp. CFH 32150]